MKAGNDVGLLAPAFGALRAGADRNVEIKADRHSGAACSVGAGSELDVGLPLQEFVIGDGKRLCAREILHGGARRIAELCGPTNPVVPETRTARKRLIDREPAQRLAALLAELRKACNERMRRLARAARDEIRKYRTEDLVLEPSDRCIVDQRCRAQRRDAFLESRLGDA